MFVSDLCAASTPLLASLLLVSCAQAQEPLPAPPPQPVRVGGLELSGAIAVDGGVLLVDDEQVGSLLFAPASGLADPLTTLVTRQVKLQRRRLSSRPHTDLPRLFAIEDIEDLAGDGEETVYVLGSHAPRADPSGATRRPEREFIVRAKWDRREGELKVRTPKDARGREGLYTGLIDDLAKEPAATPIPTSINAEGLALAGKETLYVGLRTPLTSKGMALVFRTDADGLFGREAQRTERSFTRLELDLGGAGVRALHWDRAGDVLLVLSGPTLDSAKQTPFTLWSFAPKTAKLARLHTFTKAERTAIGSPEGVCRLDERTLIVAGDREGAGGGGLLRLR